MLATSCGKVYPSEYAYLQDSVYASERSGANCRNYPSGLEPSIRSEDYIHCDGIPLRLADSDYGSEPYNVNSTEYYVWDAETRYRRFLLIFPTRVDMALITLHYYSDSMRGVPHLIIYPIAEPDHFYVWDSLTINDVHLLLGLAPPGSQPGHRNVSFDSLGINTTKILIIIEAGNFALSEVELYQQCDGEPISYINYNHNYYFCYFVNSLCYN